MGQRDSKVSMVDDTTPAESTPARPADVEDVAPAGAAPLDIPKLLNILNSEEKPHYKSDLIRLYLIYNYGGIYLDASVCLFTPLDWVLEKINNKNKIL